jgi:hypothetical protein
VTKLVGFRKPEGRKKRGFFKNLFAFFDLAVKTSSNPLVSQSLKVHAETLSIPQRYKP